MKTPGKTIRTAREAKGMTTEQLAKKIGISPGYLGHLERDSHVHLSERLVAALKKALGIRLTAKAVTKHNDFARNWNKRNSKKAEAKAKRKVTSIRKASKKKASARRGSASRGTSKKAA